VDCDSDKNDDNERLEEDLTSSLDRTDDQSELEQTAEIHRSREVSPGGPDNPEQGAGEMAADEEEEYVDAEGLLESKLDASKTRTAIPSDHEGTVKQSENDVPRQGGDDELTLVADKYASETVDQELDADSEFDIDESATSCEHKIQGFEVLEELGRGAFGVVYRARDLKLDRHVAIKIPLLANQELASKYIQEARNAAQIDAVGIVPVFQIGETESGFPFVVQKLIDGSTLYSLLGRAKSLPASWAIQMVAKVATAIAQAHQAGLVHRDLKPANILIDPSGEPWVADFGLAVFEEDQRNLRGEVAGTPAYMAPEQFSGRADWLDGRADIWALGIILYQALSGKPPFEGKGFDELQEQIRYREARPLTQRQPSLPAELDRVFSRCCAKDVSQRYPSAAELAEDLNEILRTSDLPLHGISLDETADGQTTIRSRAVEGTLARKSIFGAKTIVQPRAAERANRLLAPALGFVAVGCCIGFAVIWNRLNDSTIPVADTKQLESQSGDVAAEEPPAVMERVRERIVVSQSEGGTHQTLREALAEALPGETIFVQPGTYRLGLVLKDIKVDLVGEGARDDVRLVGDNQSAFKVDAGSEVSLRNLSIEVDGEDLNTIELSDARLSLLGCRVLCDSYDCIKAGEGASLIIDDCQFVSGKHPAVVAKDSADLRVSDSDFRFDVLNIGVKSEDPVTGVQLTNSPSSFSGCTFTGSQGLGKGISAAETARLTIDDCDFTNLLRGVELFDVKQVELGRLSRFENCKHAAIYAEGSQAELQDFDIRECKIGVRADAQSNLVVRNGTFLESDMVALWVHDSQVELEQCRFEKNKQLAIVVDCRGADSGVRLSQTSIQSNQIGLCLIEGRVEMRGGLVSQNSQAGFAVVGQDMVSGRLRSPSRNSGETPQSSIREIDAQSATLNAKGEAPAILFSSPGRYRLKDCAILDLSNQNKPELSDRLTRVSEEEWVRVVLRTVK
jgi:serine/threonine protein kinase